MCFCRRHIRAHPIGPPEPTQNLKFNLKDRGKTSYSWPCIGKNVWYENWNVPLRSCIPGLRLILPRFSWCCMLASSVAFVSIYWFHNWTRFSRVNEGEISSQASSCSDIFPLDPTTGMWKHMFSHARGLVSDAQCVQSVPNPLADTLAAFTLSALER